MDTSHSSRHDGWEGMLTWCVKSAMLRSSMMRGRGRHPSSCVTGLSISRTSCVCVLCARAVDRVMSMVCAAADRKARERSRTRSGCETKTCDTPLSPAEGHLSCCTSCTLSLQAPPWCSLSSWLCSGRVIMQTLVKPGPHLNAAATPMRALGQQSPGRNTQHLQGYILSPNHASGICPHGMNCPAAAALLPVNTPLG